MRSRGRSWIQI